MTGRDEVFEMGNDPSSALFGFAAPPPRANAFQPGGHQQNPFAPQHTNNPYVPVSPQNQGTSGQQPGLNQLPEIFNNPMAKQMGGAIFNPVMQQTQQTGKRWFHALKYYFAVDNSYVWRKLRLLFFPWSNKNWTRSKDQAGMDYLPPTQDINAPDLYLPVMAVVTYILIVGFFTGATHKQFSPEVVGTTLSSAILIVGLEVLLVRLGLWILNFEALPLLDLCSYSGYKFVNATANILVSLLAGSTGFWVAFVINSFIFTIFLVRSIKESLQLPASVHSPLVPRNNLVVFWALCQIFLSYWLYYFLDFSNDYFGNPSPSADTQLDTILQLPPTSEASIPDVPELQ